MIAWGLWLSLLGATLSASVLGVFLYAAWSTRWKHEWLGATAEWAAAVLIVFLSFAGIFCLLGHIPR